jgi:hypothetical protein
MGTGDERVYAYTFFSYQNRGTRYPIKIGMTRQGSAEKRILQQLGASNAEIPVLLLEISCENAALLERQLHVSLKGKHIIGVPGKEWFETNPEEIMSRMRTIDPRYVETFKHGMMVLVDRLCSAAYRATSGLWQLFCWLVEVSTRVKRKAVQRRYRRLRKRTEETLARGALLAVFILCFGFCATL